MRSVTRVIVLAFLASLTLNGAMETTFKPQPDYRNYRYGPHERNVLDLWLADSTEPTPLVIYIHGGGFRGGNKSSLAAQDLQEFLDAGISVAALHYRLVPEHKLPAAHQDCRRAIQFLRWRSSELNLDRQRVGAFGGSAGAQLSMWLAFHDDMARPDSPDPVARESTRLTCVATRGGQTTMDFEWWKKWIPGYTSYHRTPQEYFGVKSGDQLNEVIADLSALSLISSDDPPIFMQYIMSPDEPVPSDPSRAQGWKVHHVMFGVKLKQEMDSLGVEAHLSYPGADSIYQSIPEFLKLKLASQEIDRHRD